MIFATLSAFLFFHWTDNEIFFFFRPLYFFGRVFFLVSIHLQQHLRWMDFFLSNARMRVCVLLRLLNSKNVRSFK